MISGAPRINVVIFRKSGDGSCVIDPDDDSQWPRSNPPIIIDEVSIEF